MVHIHAYQKLKLEVISVRIVIVKFSMRRTAIIIKSINYGSFVDVDVVVTMVALRKFITALSTSTTTSNNVLTSIYGSHSACGQVLVPFNDALF